METNNYTDMTQYTVFAIAAFIVGMITDNKLLLVTGYIFIVMAQIAYLMVVTKSTKNDLENLKS